MATGVRWLVPGIRSGWPTIVVLALLAAIGWWGATHEWALPSPFAGERSGEENEQAKQPEVKDRFKVVIQLASEQAVEDSGIKVEPAVLRSLPEYVRAHGELDYNQNRLAHLASRAPGTVWSVEKEIGDEVKKGDVLALVSSAEVGKAKAEFHFALTQYQIRSKNLERMKSAENSVPPRQILEAEGLVREAHIHLFSAQQSLLNLGLEIHLKDIETLPDEEVVRRLRVLGLPRQVLRRMDPETLTSSLLPLTAPFNSVIVQRDIVVGEPVSTTAMHFTVADLSELWLMLNIRLEDIGRVARDQEVVFRPDAVSDKVPSGRIVWLGAEVDPKTRMVPIRVDIPNPGGRLRPHHFGDASILVGRHDGVVAVPDGAVQWIDRKNVVFVQQEKPTQFQPRLVEVGLRSEGSAEIRSGLKAGERIAVSGHHALMAEMFKDRFGAD
jgi:cobalt-zinc-cadmium efflux system membrane fusion protein